jgi:ribokinase
MGLDAVGFGALNYDYLYIVDTLAYGDQQVIIKKSHGSPGGSSANTIYGLAKLGLRTGFVGAVGDDPEGKEIISIMNKIGINISKIKKSSSKDTSKVFVFINRHGERAMYSLPGASNVFRFDNKDIKWLSSSKYIIISSIPSEDQLQYQLDVISTIQNSKRIVFMPGAIYIKYGFQKLKEIIKRTNLMILNHRELQELTKKDYHAGAKWLIDQGCSIVAVTLGEKGSFICNGEISSVVGTYKITKEKIVDSTGAGDAFAAGLIYGLLNKNSLTKATLYGNLAAGFCIQGLGARFGLPDKDRLEKEFEKYSKLIEK